MSYAGMLMAWIDTDIPGYREFDCLDSVPTTTTVTAVAGYWHFWDYIFSSISPSMPAGWAIDFDPGLAQVAIAGPGTATEVRWSDRSGFLLGYDKEPYPSEPAEVPVGSRFFSRAVPPGAIPLLGATHEEVDLRRERVLHTSRFRRGYGYIFGGARIWRWKLTVSGAGVVNPDIASMSRALNAGFVGSGKVSIVMKGAATWAGAIATPFSSAALGGMLTGYVIAIENIDRVQDALLDTFEVSLLMATDL